MENINAGRRGRAKGLSLYSCPIEIPPPGNQGDARRNRFSLDSNVGTPETSPDADPDSPLRTIATQTPTEHYTFHYPDFSTSPTGASSDVNDSPSFDRSLKTVAGEKVEPVRRKTNLYGKHSFRSAGEKSWFPFSDWIPGTPQLFNRGSKLNRSMVIRDRSKSHSMSSGIEGVASLGQQLRSIADDLEVRTRSRSSLNQSFRDD